MNKAVNNNILSDDWADNLLLKDKSGKLHHFKEQDSIIEAKSSSNIEGEFGKIPDSPHFEYIKTIEGTSQDKADFDFHPDDKEQLIKMKETIPVDDSKKYSIKKIVNRLIEKQSLKFDQDNVNKFTDILFDFFRNRKSVPDTRLLLEQLNIGKVKIQIDIVDSVMSIVKGIKNKMEDVGGLIVKEDLIKEAPKPIIKEPKVEIPKPVKEEVDSLPKVVRPNMQPMVKKQISGVVKDKHKLPTPEKVASPHILAGPIQELKSLSLNNFRLLGDTIEQRKEKLLNKIDILSKESFTKRSQGIDAWRQSDVYKEYLILGNESMIKSKDVSDLIDDYVKQGKDTLTIEEFSIVSDINKELRF